MALRDSSAFKLSALLVAAAGTAYAFAGPPGLLAPLPEPLPALRAQSGLRGAQQARFDTTDWKQACDDSDLPELGSLSGLEYEPVRRLAAEAAAWTGQRDGDALGRMGEIAVALDQHESALALFAAAAELGRERAHWTYMLGAECQMVGDLETAVRVLRRALELDPALALAHARLGRALFDLGESEAARKEFERCLAVDETSALGRVGLARLALGAGRHAEALGHLDDAARRTSGDYLVWQLRSQALAGLGRSEESKRDALRAAALPHYRGWLSFDPRLQKCFERARTLRTLENLFASAQSRGDARALAQVADEMAERAPLDAEAWRRAAGVQAHIGELGEARKRIERALAAEPRSVPALCTAAEICLSANDPASAQSFAHRALEIDSVSGFAHEVQARVQFLQGQSGAALASIRRAVELEPQDDGHRRVLVEILSRVGRREEALAELEALLKLRPDDAWAIEQLKQFKGQR